MKKNKVLVVEDQIAVATNIRLLLKFNGYEIIGPAVNSEEAFALIEEHMPDLIVMDIMLPGKYDGIEATAIIKKKWDIPVIFLTARTDSETITRAKESEAYAYLTKDIQLKDQLPILVEFVLYKSKMEKTHNQSLKELHSNEKKLSSVVNTAADAIIFLDKDFNITFWNASAESMFQYDSENVIGKNVFDLIAPEVNKEQFIKEFNYYYTAYFENTTRNTIELDAARSDGSALPIELSLSAFKIEDDDFTCAIIRDVSIRRDNEKDMERLVEELRVNQDILEENASLLVNANIKLSESEENLQKINEDKNKFFSIISHDLKGPFQGLLGYSEVLSKELDNLSPEEIKEFSTDLYSTSKHLFKLLENLLQWSRLQQGTIKCIPTELNLSQLVGMNFDLLQQNASLKSVKLINEVDKDVCLYADMNMINTVLRNLISNAVKFTNADDTITVRATKSIDKYIISVTDTGTGIPEDTIHSMFKIASPNSTPGTNDEKGTGLGLILCKELIEKNKGEISVESTLGEGSSFIFTVPAGSVEENI